jgi:hypothetical protein
MHSQRSGYHMAYAPPPMNTCERRLAALRIDCSATIADKSQRQECERWNSGRFEGVIYAPSFADRRPASQCAGRHLDLA